MKKAIINLLFVVVTGTCYCQQPNPLATLSVENYRKKAKDQRVVAAILGGTGIVLSTGSIYIGLNRGFFDDANDLAVPFYSGIILIAGSVPFIFAAD